MISVPVNSVWMLGVEFLWNLFSNLSSLNSSRPPNTSENGGLRGRQHETKTYSQFVLLQHPLFPLLEILAQILSHIFLHLNFRRRTQKPAMLSQTPSTIWTCALPNFQCRRSGYESVYSKRDKQDATHIASFVETKN